jgi:hypothetical protein
MPTYFHSITATPPARDDEPWVSARLEGRASASDPVVAIETVPLDPLDADPSTPLARTLTTDLAPFAEGFIRVVFIDAGGQESPPSALIATPGAPVDTGLLSSGTVLAETAALMAHRLRSKGFSAGQGGTEEATFTELTTPTLARAQTVTLRNTRLVAGDFPSAGEDDVAELTTIAALRAAIELENSAPTIDDTRIENWRDQLREYVERAGSGGGSDTDELGQGDPLEAAWSFPGVEPCHTPGSELVAYPVKHEYLPRYW